MKTNAFLSYSHSDAKLAKRISRRLRRYRPPRKSKAAGRSLEIFRDEEQLTAAADLQKILEENVCKSELARAMMTGIEAAEFYMVRLLSRQEMRVAVAQPIWDNHEIVQQPKPRRWFQFNPNAAWQPLRLPVSDQTKILDIVPVNAQRSIVLVITESEGLFRTTDAGESWENLNIGREVFLRAKQIKVIVAPGPTVYALAILSTKPDADLNPLFLLRHRSWSDRWRLGLAERLSEEYRP